MTEELKVTSPEEYAEKARQANANESTGFLHKLKKTGAVVRLRHADMEGLALTGALPMSLVAAATRTDADTEQGTETQPKDEPTKTEIEEGIKAAIFMRQMVVENCLEPRIRHIEGVGVFFVDSYDDGDMAVDMRFRVHPDDFSEMFAVISGQEGNDGAEKFRNRAQRRASASKSGRKTLRTKAVNAADRQPASA